MSEVNLITHAVAKSSALADKFFDNDIFRTGNKPLYSSWGMRLNGISEADGRLLFDGSDAPGSDVALTAGQWVARELDFSCRIAVIRLYSTTNFGTDWAVYGLNAGGDCGDLSEYTVIASGAGGDGTLNGELVVTLSAIANCKAYLFYAVGAGTLAAFEGYQNYLGSNTVALGDEVTCDGITEGNIYSDSADGSALTLKFEQKMGIALIDEVRFYGEEATNANVDIYYSTDDVIYTQITTADIQTQSTVSTGAGASKIWQAGDAGKSMVIGRINGAGNPYNFTEGIVNRVDVKLSNGGVGNAQLKLGICRQVGAYFRLVGPVASATIGGGAWYTFNFSPAVIIGADDYLVLHAHGALGDVYIYGGSLATSFYYGSWDIDTVESMALASLTAGANTAIINVDTYHGYKGEDFSAAPIEAKYWKLEHAVPASLSRKIFSLSVIAHPDTVDFYEDAGGLTPVFPEPVDEGSYTPGVYKEYTKYAKFTSDPPAGTSSGAVGMADPDPNFINYGIEVSFSAVFATVCRHCANNNLISCAASNTNWKLKANPDNGVAGCGMGCPDWTQTAMVSYAAVINDGDLIPFYVRTYYEEIINEEGGALIGFII